MIHIIILSENNLYFVAWLSGIHQEVALSTGLISYSRTAIVRSPIRSNFFFLMAIYCLSPYFLITKMRLSPKEVTLLERLYNTLEFTGNRLAGIGTIQQIRSFSGVIYFILYPWCLMFSCSSCYFLHVHRDWKHFGFIMITGV